MACIKSHRYQHFPLDTLYVLARTARPPYGSVPAQNTHARTQTCFYCMSNRLSKCGRVLSKEVGHNLISQKADRRRTQRNLLLATAWSPHDQDTSCKQATHRSNKTQLRSIFKVDVTISTYVNFNHQLQILEQSAPIFWIL